MEHEKVTIILQLGNFILRANIEHCSADININTDTTGTMKNKSHKVTVTVWNMEDHPKNRFEYSQASFWGRRGGGWGGWHILGVHGKRDHESFFWGGYEFLHIGSVQAPSQTHTYTGNVCHWISLPLFAGNVCLQGNV